MDKLLLAGMILVLSACGGGGGDGGKEPQEWESYGFVSITPPDQDLSGYRSAFTRTSSGTFETTLTRATFNGGVSVTDDSECGGDPGFEVTLTNAANGVTTRAAERVNCDLIFRSGKWQAASVALEIGSNRLTASGAGDTDSITVVRINPPPRVVSVFPADGSIDIALTNVELRVTFSKDLDPATVTSDSFILEDTAGTMVAGTVAYESKNEENNTPSTATLTVTAGLQPGTMYTARLTTAIADTHNTFLASEFSWSFRSFEDLTPPNLVAKTPAIGDVCVAPDESIAVRFDEPPNPGSLTSATFTVQDSAGTPLLGSIALNGLVASFTPETPLELGETYTAQLSSGVTDSAGNALAPESWSFATANDAEGSWTSIATATSLAPRSDSSAVWTGSEMIIWGGRGQQRLNDGARYNPISDQWTDVSLAGAPLPRSKHTSTWTGTEMIVWGGGDQTLYADGARYDPVSDVWQSMSTDLAPSGRYGHSAIWTGTELIVWGGQWQGAAYFSSGARYNPATDTWTRMSMINAPSPRTYHHATFDGQRMIVWGGSTQAGCCYFQAEDGGIYDPVADVWTPLPVQNMPASGSSVAEGNSVVQAGQDLLVWLLISKWVVDPFYSTGHWETVSEARRYSSAQEQWLTIVDACETSATPNAVWSNGRMLSWNDDYSDGYAYDEVRDAWHPVTALPIPVSKGTTVIAIGDSVILWDGARAFPNVGFRLSL